MQIINNNAELNDSTSNWAHLSCLWAIISLPTKRGEIIYTSSILPFFLSKGNSFYTADHPTPHDSRKVPLIPSSQNGQDPFMAIVAIPCLHVAQLRNENGCWEAHGKGFLPLEKAIERSGLHTSSEHWRPGPGQPASCQSEHKINTLWRQIHIAELQGYCHTTPRC